MTLAEMMALVKATTQHSSELEAIAARLEFYKKIAGENTFKALHEREDRHT